jgi:methionyl-tRNA synthetase
MKELKNEPEKAQQVVYNCLWLTKALAVIMEPVMPKKAEELWLQLTGEPRSNVSFNEALEPFKPGTKIDEPKTSLQADARSRSRNSQK